MEIGARVQAGAIDGYANPISLLSANAAGTAGNNESSGPSMSADGRYVAFVSTASNLVAGDANGVADVFVKDTLTGEIRLVSTNSNGVAGNGAAGSVKISADGRFVAFTSSATNLVPGDTNGVADLFLKNLETGEIKRVSTDSNGNQSVVAVLQQYALSADGSAIAFISTDPTLVDNDTNGFADVFYKNVLTGETRRVNTNAMGSQTNGDSSMLSMSADGRYVSFTSNANNLVAGDTNNGEDLFVKDIKTGEIQRASTNSAGGQLAGHTTQGSVSADGKFVIFRSGASNVMPGVPAEQIYVKHLETGEVFHASSRADGSSISLVLSGSLSLSADGRYAVFATSLHFNPLIPIWSVYRKDLTTGALEQINTAPDGTAALGAPTSIGMSADGRFLSFASTATTLTPGDTNGFADVFYRDMQGAGLSEMSGMVVSDQANAKATLGLVRRFRDDLHEYRGRLGATSSRLDVFSKNLEAAGLNYSFAASRITDADIAEETSALVTSQIRQQTAVALLAQANQQPQTVLQLLETA